MRFKKHDGSFFELKVREATPSFLINFDLQPKSDRTFYSIDRGVRSDRYSTLLSFTQPTTYIDEMVRELKLLRDNNKKVIIDNIPEPIFADNIDHSFPLLTVVYELKNQKGADLKISSIDLELILEQPTFKGSYTLPAKLNCVSTSYEGYTIWNTHVNESYYRTNWFIDREADTFEFTGEYVLSVEDNADLIMFWRQQRGTPFRINDGRFGVPYMFGGSGGNTTHDVIMTEVSYKYISPTLRQTTVKLVKVG